MAQPFIIYGSYGYTGNLIATLAVQRNMRPVLAGRDVARLRLQALGLGLDHRAFSLDNPAEVDAVLRDYPLVLHCAGPFSRTANPMVDACLRTGTHYLDVTGEIAVFEALIERSHEAQDAGVMLLPGAGFDVVPTDCLAMYLKKRLPTANHLALAFTSVGSGFSHGTAFTMLENLHKGSAIRQDRRIVRVPFGKYTREIDFGRGPKNALSIPWGDVSTAYHSTGIPNIEVYSGSVGPLKPLMLFSRFFPGIVRTNTVQEFLKSRIKAAPPGPNETQRKSGRAFVWGEVTNSAGQRLISRLVTPEGYKLTAQTALAAAEKALAGQAKPGYQTPSLAYGADFIMEFEGVTREDLE